MGEGRGGVGDGRDGVGAGVGAVVGGAGVGGGGVGGRGVGGIVKIGILTSRGEFVNKRFLVKLREQQQALKATATHVPDDVNRRTAYT